MHACIPPFNRAALLLHLARAWHVRPPRATRAMSRLLVRGVRPTSTQPVACGQHPPNPWRAASSDEGADTMGL
jgi:hypothetical protein